MLDRQEDITVLKGGEVEVEKFVDSPFEGELEIIATLRDQAVMKAIALSDAHEELRVAVRSAAASGVNIDALSDASGVSPDKIRQISAV